MLTIKIPEVNAAKSAEDRLAQFILDGLESSKYGYMSFDYYHSGCAIGQCCDTSVGYTSLDVIDSVLCAFRKAGYLVDVHHYGNNLATVAIRK